MCTCEVHIDRFRGVVTQQGQPGHVDIRPGKVWRQRDSILPPNIQIRSFLPSLIHVYFFGLTFDETVTIWPLSVSKTLILRMATDAK